MALTLQIKVTANGIKEALPTGYTAPTISNTFSSSSVKLPAKNFVIAASGNVNANPATGLSNFVTALSTAITTWLGDGDGNLGFDETTNTIIAVGTITNVIRRAKEDSESKFETGGDELVFTVEVEIEVTA